MSFESAESFKEDSDVKNIQETKQILSKDRKEYKRIRIQSIEINILKKIVSEYLVCDLKEYSLAKC